ncbi:hypothetical protein KY347_01550 [Candidatus Woesearchaeota archaeon]|nr:hypothetical protein [Candidatus Woesearchaeota archaeon]
MKAVKIFIIFLVVILAADISYSFSANSSNYKLFPLIVSSGGEIVNGSTYKNYVATGIIAHVINSSTYKNFLGFFYTWLLADGQPCTSASQCEGGYCCSNLCSSSACPTGGGEGPAAPGGGGGAAAGGGGGGALPTEEKEDFIITPQNIKEKLTLGESSEKTLKVRNTGNTGLTVSLTVEGIKEYLSLSDNSISLEAKTGAEVTLDFAAKKVGSFAGEITAKAGEIEKSVPAILEVITKLVLFDVKLDIPLNYQEVELGDELKTQITLLNVGVPTKVDVFASYFIKDLRGNIIYEETETFAVEKQASYPKSFRIHESTVPGSYVAITEVRYADSFAVSSQLFRVTEKKKLIEMKKLTTNTAIVLFLAFILVGITSMLIYKLASITKKGKIKKKAKKQK